MKHYCTKCGKWGKLNTAFMCARCMTAWMNFYLERNAK